MKNKLIASVIILLTLNHAQYIRYFNPEYISETVTSGSVTFGISAYSGGCVTWTDIGDDTNIQLAGNGWAGQTAFRAGMMQGYYNPTQAGINRDYGVLTLLNKTAAQYGSGGRVDVGTFRIPLFTGESGMDFTQQEDIAADKFASDGGNTDTDGIDESSLSQEYEIKSELEYDGYYDDVSSVVGNGIPVIRHVFSYTFNHDPDAILQFGAGAVGADSQPVIDENNRIVDMSPDYFAGTQGGQDDDINLATQTYSHHINWSAGFQYVMWMEDSTGLWQNAAIPQAPTAPVRVFCIADQNTVEISGNPWQNLGGGPAVYLGTSRDNLWLISKGTDPAASEAMAMYFPQHGEINSKPIVGIDKATSNIIYSEDRRIRIAFEADRRGPGGAPTTIDYGAGNGGSWTYVFDEIFFRARHYYTGLMAPDNVPGQIAYERIRCEVYTLFGTPNEIMAAVQDLKVFVTNPAAAPPTVTISSGPTNGSELKLYPSIVRPDDTHITIEGITPDSKKIRVYNINGDLVNDEILYDLPLYTADDGKEYAVADYKLGDLLGWPIPPGLYFVRVNGKYLYFQKLEE